MLGHEVKLQPAQHIASEFGSVDFIECRGFVCREIIEHHPHRLGIADSELEGGVLIASGTFVRLKRDPACAGILLEGDKSVAGARMVQVRLADGQVKWLPYSALEHVPSAPETLMDLFAGGKFVEPDWLRRTLTRLRVTGRLSDVVYSMEATETDFYAYQFKPVIKLMSSPTDAMLVADEVGLGKTIEAGLVWTELRARLDCDRLLVACPKTLCQKWQDELARRFGVEAQIGDAVELLGALRRTHETGRGYALVCSMQGLRPPRGWDDDPEEGEGKVRSTRHELARFLDEASHGEPLIDLLVVDEAHHMRNPKTLLNRFGRLANSVASHRLFLSATPIHLRNRDLHSVLAMVDPDTFEFEGTLEELIETNAPVIAARDLLLRPDSSVADIEALLDSAQDHDILRHSRALAQIRHEVTTTPLDKSKRSELAARIERGQSACQLRHPNSTTGHRGISRHSRAQGSRPRDEPRRALLLRRDLRGRDRLRLTALGQRALPALLATTASHVELRRILCLLVRVRGQS